MRSTSRKRSRRRLRLKMTEARKKWIRKQARFKGIFDRNVYPEGVFGKRIPLSSTVVYDEERVYIREALDAGLNGAQTERFEKELAAYVGLKYGVALSSGQAALHMALKLAVEKLYGSSTGLLMPGGLGRAGCLQGKRVFCSDLTTADMVNPIVFEGGDPVFIDSAEGTDWSMDPEVLKLAFVKYPDVKIVVMNHVYGFPGQAAEIKRICDERGALFIECAGEALGAEYRVRKSEAEDAGYRAEDAKERFKEDRAVGNECRAEKVKGWRNEDNAFGNECKAEADEADGSSIWVKAGSLGNYCVLGFGRDKMLGHSGGALLTRDAYSAEKARYWASGARAATLWNQHEELGYGCLLDELTAASLRGQLLHLDEMIARKKRIYERYYEKLDGAMACVIPAAEGTKPGYCVTAMICESNIQFQETRDDRKYTYEDIHGTAAPMEILEALEAFHVESRPVYKPMSLQPVFRNHEHFTLDGPWRMYESFWNDTFWQRCDMAKQYYESGICLPSDTGMTQEEQERVMEIICACYCSANFDREEVE